MPPDPRDVSAECAAVRHAVGLFNVSHHGWLRAVGPERAAFLHRLASNDVQRLAPGQGCHALLLNDHARIIADLHIFALQDCHELHFHTDAAAAKARQWLERYHFGERVEMQDLHHSRGAFALQGPGAQPLLESLAIPVHPFQPLDHAKWRLDGQWIHVMRHSLTGSPGYVLSCDESVAETLRRTLVRAGSTFGLQPAGGEALNVLRIEAGIPWYGRELDDTVLAPEAGLASAISLDKGCYIGQEIIARLDSRGQLQRALCGLRFDGATPPTAGGRVCLDGRDVGAITSAVYSPTLQRAIALAYLHRSAWAPETVVTTSALTARVVALPFLTRPEPVP